MYPCQANGKNVDYDNDASFFHSRMFCSATCFHTSPGEMKHQISVLTYALGNICKVLLLLGTLFFKCDFLGVSLLLPGSGKILFMWEKANTTIFFYWVDILL